MQTQLNCLKMFLFWSVPADNSLATKRLEIRNHKKDVCISNCRRRARHVQPGDYEGLISL